MATPPNDDTKALFRLLLEAPGDDGWHRYEEVRDAVAGKVPPGRAIRKYEERLRSSRKTHGSEKQAAPLSEDDQIRFGARACAQIAISSWKGRGLMQRIDEGGQKWIKVKPGFQSYGLTMSEPGEEDRTQAPKGSEEAGGSTEVPRGDSEPFEAAPQTSDEVAEAVADWRQEASALMEQEPPVSSADEGSWTERARQFERDANGEWVSTELPPGVTPEPVFDPIGASASPQQPSHTVAGSELQECPVCGALMIDPKHHGRWHEDQMELFEQLAAELLDIVTVRTAIKEETGHLLDQFQGGLQSYLEQQFAQVAGLIHGLRTPALASARWAERGVRTDPQ